MSTPSRAAQGLQRKVAGVRVEGRGEQQRVQRRRRLPGDAGERAIAPQHRDIESNVVTDEDTAAKAVRHVLEHGAVRLGVRHHRIGDAMNGDRSRGNLNPRVDQPVDGGVAVDLRALHSDGAD